MRGYYTVPAISLTAKCEAYSPEYILLWLPNEKMFGTWDEDHWVLLVFRGASWDDIVKDPLPYLNAQWDDAKCLGSYIEPWKSYEFKPGRPF